jgi:rRNA maturation endonuclease Nob1
MRNGNLTSATVALVAQEKLARKSIALNCAENFEWRNRCAGCATKFQAENPLR